MPIIINGPGFKFPQKALPEENDRISRRHDGIYVLYSAVAHL